MHRIIRFAFPALVAASLACASPAVQAETQTLKTSSFQLAQAKEPLEPIGGQLGGTSYGEPGGVISDYDAGTTGDDADDNDRATDNPGTMTAIMLALIALGLAAGMFVMHRFNHTEDMRPM